MPDTRRATSVKEPTERTAPDDLTARGKRTRAALLKAARVVFERDGFHAARITDIADEASVAHGTFYTYFDSKEEIFLDLIRDLQAELLGWTAATESRSHKQLSAIERLERGNRLYLQICRSNGRLIAIWEQVIGFNEEAAAMHVKAREAFVKRTLEQIKRLKSEGAIDPEINPRYAAHALTGMVSHFASTWLSGRERFSFEEAVTQLTMLWANALGMRAAVSSGAQSA